MDTALFGPRMATLGFGILGAMGAILAVVGVFGMAAYSVGKRLRELDIRVALGGQRKEVLQAALGRAFKLLFFGSAADYRSAYWPRLRCGSGHSARSAGACGRRVDDGHPRTFRGFQHGAR